MTYLRSTPRGGSFIGTSKGAPFRVAPKLPAAAKPLGEGQIRCPECGRGVSLLANGKIRGHRSRGRGSGVCLATGTIFELDKRAVAG